MVGHEALLTLLYVSTRIATIKTFISFPFCSIENMLNMHKTDDKKCSTYESYFLTFCHLWLFCCLVCKRLQKKGIKTILISGDREEAVATIAQTVGIGSEFVNASLTPQQKSRVISTLQTAGHRIAMV